MVTGVNGTDTPVRQAAWAWAAAATRALLLCAYSLATVSQ